MAHAHPDAGCTGTHVGPAERQELLGCPFDPKTMASAVDQCVRWCLEPRASHTVITVNAAILCMMRRTQSCGRPAAAADLILADGVPVVWTSRLAGVPLPSAFPGSS